MLISYVYYLYKSPELVEEIKEAGVNSYLDALEWGKSKVAFDLKILQEGLGYVKNENVNLEEIEDNAM